MATISYGDLLKRTNVQVFADRVSGKGGFQLQNEQSITYKATGKVTITQNGKPSMFDGNLSASALQTFLDSRSSADALDVELIDGNIRKFYRVTQLYKDREFGGTASKSSGQGSERQELGLIQALNEAAAKYDKAYVRQIGQLDYLRKAYKNEGLSSVGQEPYIDVFIETSRRTLGISCKGTSAPSLAGGGTAGLKVIAPDLLNKLYRSIENYITRDLKLKSKDVVAADSIPDLFLEIPANYVELILKGNERMGGPIDYMYVGQMDVTSNLNTPGIQLNGNFYGIKEYMQKIGKFYFRIRKRDIEPTNTVMIELTQTNREGYKMMFRGPKSGKNNLRIVITDKVPSTGKILRL